MFTKFYEKVFQGCFLQTLPKCLKTSQTWNVVLKLIRKNVHKTFDKGTHTIFWKKPSNKPLWMWKCFSEMSNKNHCHNVFLTLRQNLLKCFRNINFIQRYQKHWIKMFSQPKCNHNFNIFKTFSMLIRNVFIILIKCFVSQSCQALLIMETTLSYMYIAKPIS